jgi:integrase
VPLTPKVTELLEKLPEEQERVFPITDVAVRQSWDRLRRRAGITDLTFHDLRHEAISRQFERGLSIPHVMAISGHQTASQLFRYIQLVDTDPVNM